MRRNWVLMLIAFSLLTGMAMYVLHFQRQSAAEADSTGRHGPTASVAIPDWLYEDMRSQFPSTDQSQVKREAINLLQVQMLPDAMGDKAQPELAASLTLDQTKGAFVLYAEQNGRYEAVYRRQEPVQGIQLLGAGEKMIVLTAGHTEGGKQEYDLYVIRHTPEGYKEVWSGVGHYLDSQETSEMVDGSLQLDRDGNLIYLQLRRMVDSTGSIMMEQSSSRLFAYDQEKHHFEPK